ncbi:RluA family pseudouridine synthase [Nanchangia anserum]|uniref:Pseudouridine synthase n=1 Tax=Nanchangia anserum TaxID=2692125 RepID=A0A8I0KQQ5_9ACTO|nr:RluA family pseudouridine synthase [Nanchangia anserum]MBD3690230.1 RluA family pseudouridine synthase [Nanchangia anserum]QOX82325.1 RluA family pseudouridine synthase [Nanchangia anserum]
MTTQWAEVDDSLHDERVDVGLSRLFGISRSQAGVLVRSGEARVNGATCTKAHKLRVGDVLEVDLPDETEPDLRTPADLDILYEDDELVVVNKPVGMAAHTGPGWSGPTVIGALLAAGHRVSTSGPPERTGIVHRLDAATTGAMVVAKTELAYAKLKNDFRYRRVGKIYHALVQGYPDPTEGSIDAPIGRHPSRDFKMGVVYGGKPALTHYRTLEVLPGATLLEVELETGRTHQIRVHMQAIGHPIVGDSTYGADPVLAASVGMTRQWLHARNLTFDHPLTRQRVDIEAPYTSDLSSALTAARASVSRGPRIEP